MRTLALSLLVIAGPVVAAAQPPRTFTPEQPPKPNEETVLNARVVSVNLTTRHVTVRGVDIKADGGRTETFPVAEGAAERLRELRPGTEVLLSLLGHTVIDIKVSVKSGGEGGAPMSGAARPAPRARSTGAATGGVVTAPGSVVITPGTTTAASPGVPGTRPFTNRDLPSPATTTASPATRPQPRVSAQPVASPQPGPSPQPVVSRQPGAAPQPDPSPRPVAPPKAAVGIAGPQGGVIAIGGPTPSPAGTPFPTPRPVATPRPVGPLPNVSPVGPATPAPVPTPVPVLVPGDAPPATPTPSPSPVS